MYWPDGIFRTGVHRIILKDNRCEKYRAREVEYEDQTVYCRCQYPDGGIFVYADHLCSCTGRNTSDRGYGSCVKGARQLYAMSAVLMDGDSGRVLYEKDGTKARANASTTKVLTCIVALESAPGDDYVTGVRESSVPA